MAKRRKKRRKLTEVQKAKIDKILGKLNLIEETPENASKIRAIENQIDLLLTKGSRK